MITLRPGHISVYMLDVEPGSHYFDKLQYRDGQHPCAPASVQVEQYLQVQQQLTNAGYDHYEVCSYCTHE